MSQKYVIVHFVELSKVPEEFHYSEWPLHVTLLANFTITQPIEKLIDELKTYALQVKPFEMVVNGETLFGPNQNVAVSLIQPSESINKIHKNLATITKALGAKYDEPRFMGKGFRPHATIQASSRLNDNQALTLDNFTLIDMFPGGNIERRRIVRTFKLTNKQWLDSVKYSSRSQFSTL